MKALAHWMEEEGHTKESPSTTFDKEFWDQIAERGRIEDSAVLQNFFQKTGQSLTQDWLVEMVKRMIKHLPFKHLFHSGMHALMPPKTKSWGKTGEVLKAYVKEQKEAAHG
jgi:heterodisulfide reductase subunit C